MRVRVTGDRLPIGHKYYEHNSEFDLDGPCLNVLLKLGRVEEVKPVVEAKVMTTKKKGKKKTGYKRRDMTAEG